MKRIKSRRTYQRLLDKWRRRQPSCLSQENMFHDTWECLFDNNRKSIDEWITDSRKLALAKDLSNLIAMRIKKEPEKIRFAPLDPSIVITCGIPRNVVEEEIKDELKSILLVKITSDDLDVLEIMAFVEALDYLLKRAPLYPISKLDVIGVQQSELHRANVNERPLDVAVCDDLERFLHLHLRQPQDMIKNLCRLPNVKDIGRENMGILQMYLKKRYGVENAIALRFLGLIPFWPMCLIGVISVVVVTIIMYVMGIVKPIAVAELIFPMLAYMLLVLMIIGGLSTFRWKGIRSVEDLSKIIELERNETYCKSSEVRSDKGRRDPLEI